MRCQPALGLLLQHIWKLIDNSGAEGKKKLHKHLVLRDLFSFRGLYFTMSECALGVFFCLRFFWGFFVVCVFVGFLKHDLLCKKLRNREGNHKELEWPYKEFKGIYTLISTKKASYHMNYPSSSHRSPCEPPVGRGAGKTPYHSFSQKSNWETWNCRIHSQLFSWALYGSVLVTQIIPFPLLNIPLSTLQLSK